jgi:hypothetical protein
MYLVRLNIAIDKLVSDCANVMLIKQTSKRKLFVQIRSRCFGIKGGHDLFCNVGHTV